MKLFHLLLLCRFIPAHYPFGETRLVERIPIVSRNLSWVDDEDTKELLRTKARTKDLTICVPDATEFTDELEQLGATVHKFGGNETKSRFTIINHGSFGAQVAVGATAEKAHIIGEYGAGDPVLTMAEDLLAQLSRK